MKFQWVFYILMVAAPVTFLSAFDLGVDEGVGFFVVEDPVSHDRYYVREAKFTFEDRYLTDEKTGFRLLAYPLKDGVIGGSLGPIHLDDFFSNGKYTALRVTYDGRLVGKVWNGEVDEFYLIPLAEFHNEAGLIRPRLGLHSETPCSGSPLIGQAGDSNRGIVRRFPMGKLWCQNP